LNRTSAAKRQKRDSYGACLFSKKRENREDRKVEDAKAAKNNPMKKALFLLAYLILCVSCKPAYPPVEFLTRKVTIGENTYGYRVYIPKERQPGQKLPVMLYLHGSGSNGENNERQLKDFYKIIGENPQNFSFIVVFPQARTGTFWDTQMIEQAIAALDQTVKEFDSDKKRLYLAGYSMGGLGAWHTAVLYPGKFAALVPIASRIMPTPTEREDLSPELLNLVNAPEPLVAFGEKLKDIPTWIFHGDQDQVITVGASRRLNEALIKAGNTDVHYTEYAGMDHYTIEAAMTEPKLFEWLATQRLNKSADGYGSVPGTQ
jgi:predicted peptidase